MNDTSNERKLFMILTKDDVFDRYMRLKKLIDNSNPDLIQLVNSHFNALDQIKTLENKIKNDKTVVIFPTKKELLNVAKETVDHFLKKNHRMKTSGIF